MQATLIGTDANGRHLEQLHDAERLVIDAIAAARESITRCEQALTMLSKARLRIAHEPEPTRCAADRRPQPPLVRSANGHDDGYRVLPRAGHLTPRETEVLRLIAADHSNRQIADTLFLSPRTIERHIANIYLKIDAHSKAEATAYARRHNLT